MMWSKLDVFCFLALVAFAFLCEAQNWPWQKPSVVRPLQPAQTGQPPAKQIVTSRPLNAQTMSLRTVHMPKRAEEGKLQQEPTDVQSKQMLPGTKKLVWRFPQTPAEPERPAVDFQLQPPLPADSIAAECGESMLRVAVKQDMFGIGKPIQSARLTMGGCTVAGEDPTAEVWIFESELQGCGSRLTMMEDWLVYTFTLTYAPEAISGTPIVRTNAAVIGIECYYSRKHNVSSDVLRPTWMPYASTKVAEELLVFSLKLMTDDWKFERPSNEYFLGDVLNIEASLMQYHHVPLRVFVDHCVATLVPDMNAVPRYSFIENNGCLIDAKLTGSSSRFMPRAQNDKLQFQLEAFKFKQESSGSIYMTCYLKGTAASFPTDAMHKACSFSANGWSAADEDGQVCGCCDTNCGSSHPMRKGRDLTHEGLEVLLGPIIVLEN